MNSGQLAEKALDIIKSPAAAKMLDMVTYGFYDRSRVALWMFETIGREYDDMEKWTLELRYEIFPQTCTWGMPIWEFVHGFEPDSSKSLEWRRKRVMAHRLSHPPINPARIETALTELTGTRVKIKEFVAPYVFQVDAHECGSRDGASFIFDYLDAVRLLRGMKPSHLSFTVNAAVGESRRMRRFASAVSVFAELFIPDNPGTGGHAGAEKGGGYHIGTEVFE